MLFLALVSTPVLALADAALRALILFWPTMLLLGAVHSQIAWVPALGWGPTILVVALLGLLIPTGNSASD